LRGRSRFAVGHGLTIAVRPGQQNKPLSALPGRDKEAGGPRQFYLTSEMGGNFASEEEERGPPELSYCGAFINKDAAILKKLRSPSKFLPHRVGIVTRLPIFAGIPTESRGPSSRIVYQLGLAKRSARGRPYFASNLCQSAHRPDRHRTRVAARASFVA
jgi:hypothetical protein